MRAEMKVFARTFFTEQNGLKLALTLTLSPRRRNSVHRFSLFECRVE